MTIESLLMKSKDGSEESKVELLKRCKPLIISSIRKYHNIGDYDDLIQEGNIVLLESIESFDFGYKVHFLGYLKARLKYYYLDKKMDSELSLNTEDDNGLEFIDILESDFDMEEFIVRQDEYEEIEKSINRLSNRESQIITSFYLKDMTIDQIANRLCLKYQTVANIKTAGINKLKNIVKKS